MRKFLAAAAVTGALTAGVLAVGTGTANAGPTPLCAPVAYQALYLLTSMYPHGIPGNSPVVPPVAFVLHQVC